MTAFAQTAENRPREDDKLSSAGRDKAIALVRALGTVAEGDSDYIAFAREAVMSQELVNRLAKMVSSEGMRALTDEGRREFKKAEAALSGALSFSNPFKEALADVAASCKTLEELASQSRANLTLLDGPLPDVLSAAEADAFAQFVSARMSATCYFTSLKYGSSRLRPLWNLRIDGSKPERSYLLLTEALEGLKESLRSATPYGAWRIDPVVHPGCDCIKERNGYIFRWASEDEYNQSVSSGAMHAIAPGLAVGSTDEGCQFMGMGYIVGTSPERSFALRDGNVHVELPVNAFGLKRRPLEQPIALISSFFDGDDAFCIDPQDFSAALDRHVRCVESGGV